MRMITGVGRARMRNEPRVRARSSIGAAAHGRDHSENDSEDGSDDRSQQNQTQADGYSVEQLFPHRHHCLVCACGDSEITTDQAAEPVCIALKQRHIRIDVAERSEYCWAVSRGTGSFAIGGKRIASGCMRPAARR
jgi:hypothetical protein